VDIPVADPLEKQLLLPKRGQQQSTWSRILQQESLLPITFLLLRVGQLLMRPTSHYRQLR
jgi:hypothetical protein